MVQGYTEIQSNNKLDEDVQTWSKNIQGYNIIISLKKMIRNNPMIYRDRIL